MWVSDAAANGLRPDPGYLHDKGYTPHFDALCGAGTKLSDGCDAIRAREIVDTTNDPWRSIGRVNFASIGISQHCTGTLVSERVVLTAAHCLYNFPRKAWIPAESIVFVAGFQRGAGLAISRGESYILNAHEDVTSRHFRSRPEEDWALLVLQDPIGRKVGHLEIFSQRINSVAGVDFLLPGYAGLRPNVLSIAADCGVPHGNTKNAILQRCSTMSGDSGAPLIVSVDGEYKIAGVFSSIVGYGSTFASLVVPSSQFIDFIEK